MRLYGLDYEHQPDVRNNGIIEQFNPLGRIPALILDTGEAIIDSAAILDYLDRQVGSDRSLTPLNGERRTRMLSLLALAVGAQEKAVAALYETERRPREKWYAPYAEQLAGQFKRSYEHLDNQFKGPWMMGDELSQLDVTCVACWGIGRHLFGGLARHMSVPNLDGLIERTAAIEAFAATALSEDRLEAVRRRGAVMDELTDFAGLN